jgi:hypothetical protein
MTDCYQLFKTGFSIRMSGPPLGRPPANISKEKKKQALEDERIRNPVFLTKSAITNPRSFTE